MSLNADAAQVIAFKNKIKDARDAAQAILSDSGSATEIQLVSEAQQVKTALDPIVQDLEVMSQLMTDEANRNP